MAADQRYMYFRNDNFCHSSGKVIAMGNPAPRKTMTKAERFLNTVNDDMLDDFLLAEACIASGQDPEVFNSLRYEGAGIWCFPFNDGSIFVVNIFERNVPYMRCLSVELAA